MKIYNEVSIDMNPESSSYGETLHEDSFDYDGPMALLQPSFWERLLGEGTVEKAEDIWDWGWDKYDEVTGGETPPPGKMGATSGYESSEQFSQYGGWYLMKRNKPGGGIEWYILDENQNTIMTYDGATMSEEVATNRLKGLYTSQQEDQETETAPEINYQDYEKYLDPMSGKVSDQWGFARYLKTLPKFEDKLLGDIYNLVPDMTADLYVSPSDVSKAGQEYTSKVGGIHEELGQARQQRESQKAISGVYSPTKQGFGADDYTGKFYSGLTGLQDKREDVYGLSEKALYDWIAESD